MLDVAILLGLLVGVLSAVSSVVDRVLMTDVIEEVGTIVFTSMVSTWAVTVLVVVAVGGQVTLTSTVALLAAIAAGVLKSAPLFLYFRAIREQDSTVIATVMNADPLIVVIVGVTVLGEMLSLVQYVGIAVLMGGVFLLTWTEDADDDAVLDSGVLLALFTMVLFAFQTVLYEVALDAAVSFWPVVLTTHTVAAVVGAVGLVQASVRDELRALGRVDNRRSTATVLFSELVSSFSGVVKFAALAVGFISIVTPVFATSHMFVFLLVGLLGILGVQVDTETTKRAWFFRLVAAGAVVVGVVLLQV